VFVEKHRKRLNQITKILNKPLSQKRYHDLNQEKLMLLSEINRC
jgi:hypothetical protein